MTPRRASHEERRGSAAAASGSRSEDGQKYGRSSGSSGNTSRYTSGSLRTSAER